MADVKVKIQADILPAVTAGEELLGSAIELVNTMADGDQQQKRMIVRQLKKAKKAIKYANKAFIEADKVCTSKRYIKYRDKFELYD